MTEMVHWALAQSSGYDARMEHGKLNDLNENTIFYFPLDAEKWQQKKP